MSLELFNDHSREVYDSDDVYAIMGNILRREIKIQKRKDFVWLMAINKQLSVLFIERLPIHRLETETMEPARFFKFPVMFEAAGVMLIHSHDDDGIVPTTEDMAFTERMRKAGEVLNIAVMEHMIINSKSFLSFADKGMMGDLK